MLIKEVADAGSDSKTLAALAMFLSHRADDESARKQISKDTFIELAKSRGINVTPDNLNDIISRPPLNNILEPFDPSSGVVRFKGDTEADTGMSVDQAQAVVNANAKSALKRRS
jgi:hypothetical protein